MSVLCLALGIFLFVPGLVEPQELMVPLIVGAIAIGAGIGGLWRSRKHKKNPFDKSAKILLSGKDNIPSEPALTVSFSEDGMTVSADNSNTEFVAYDGFECAIETADTVLFVYDTRVTVLQKNDLKTGDINEFCGLLAEKIAKFVHVE